MKIVAIISVLAFGISCGGCGSDSGSRSREEIISEFQVEVELANDCDVSSDCQVVYPECPLAVCGIAVNSSNVEQLKGIEDKLYAEIEEVYGRCDVFPGCRATVAECRNNKCEQVFVGENSKDTSRSKKEIVSDFEIEIELANDCTENSECTIYLGQCPLAVCGVAINSNFLGQVSKVESELSGEYVSIYGQCDIIPGCLEPVLECRNNKCEKVLEIDE